MQSHGAKIPSWVIKNVLRKCLFCNFSQSPKFCWKIRQKISYFSKNWNIKCKVQPDFSRIFFLCNVKRVKLSHSSQKCQKRSSFTVSAHSRFGFDVIKHLHTKVSWKQNSWQLSGIWPKAARFFEVTVSYTFCTNCIWKLKNLHCEVPKPAGNALLTKWKIIVCWAWQKFSLDPKNLYKSILIKLRIDKNWYF